MTGETRSYDHGTIRELLLAAFTAETLRRFCQDRPLFRPIVNQFGPDAGLADMVDEVMDYCDTQLLWDELCTGVEQVSPRQYERYAPRLLLVEPVRPSPQDKAVRPKPWRGALSRVLGRVSEPRYRRALLAAVGLLLAGAIVAGVVLGVNAYRRQLQQPKYWTDKFLRTTSSDARITYLAELIRLQGRPHDAQSLFFDRLKDKPEQQVALFVITDPAGMEEDLTLVIASLYTRLDNDRHGDELLQAMAGALADIPLQSDRAMKLSLEIEQWQEGRAHYAAAEYWDAIKAYTLALGQNDANAATHLERAQAYAGIVAYRQALDDLRRAYVLDSRRRPQIKAIITADPGLLTYLWRHASDYGVLLSGMPTLTPTPAPVPLLKPAGTPMGTVTITPTPTPTGTPAPAALSWPKVQIGPAARPESSP